MRKEKFIIEIEAEKILIGDRFRIYIRSETEVSVNFKAGSDSSVLLRDDKIPNFHGVIYQGELIKIEENKYVILGGENQ